MAEKKVLIVLADGFEEIEAISPADILRRADIDVTMAGLISRTVKGAHDIVIAADATMDELNGTFDAVVLPGGSPGASNLSRSEGLKTLIQTMHSKGKFVAAICASPVAVLVPTGILTHRKATCYAGMEKDFPRNVTFVDKAVVVDGNIVTSRGPGTAALFGLQLVHLLVGRKKMESVKKKMLFS